MSAKALAAQDVERATIERCAKVAETKFTEQYAIAGMAIAAAIRALRPGEPAARDCTCHSDDNPPRPCPQKYAYSECVAAAQGEKKCPDCEGRGHGFRDDNEPTVWQCPTCAGTGRAPEGDQ